MAIIATKPIVIAHRGASGYLPEHTLANKALAYAMRPDYLEQDLVLTKDNQLIVLHDLYLERTTDVVSQFAERQRDDGHYYALDFTLSEIRQLRVTEAFTISQDGSTHQDYPARFPLWQSNFAIATFEEELELIQGLNKSLGYNIGIYPEIKAPWFHRQHGYDISAKLLATLKRYGYSSRQSAIYLQCFDSDELKRIKQQLMPAMAIDLKLIQLIAETQWCETMVSSESDLRPYNYDWMFQQQGMLDVAEYADGIGAWHGMLVEPNSSQNAIEVLPLLSYAQQAKLDIHCYTFRADELPNYVSNFEQWLQLFVQQLKVDGLFTDHCDKVVDYMAMSAMPL